MLKITQFTKCGYVSLRSNQAVTCQRSPKIHRDVSARWFTELGGGGGGGGDIPVGSSLLEC